jgi:hypothetical protein
MYRLVVVRKDGQENGYDIANKAEQDALDELHRKLSWLDHGTVALMFDDGSRIEFRKGSGNE